MMLRITIIMAIIRYVILLLFIVYDFYDRGDDLLCV